MYGVLSPGMTQRRREIGIRMAVGAPAGQVRWIVVRLAAALAGFVFGVGVRDRVTFVAVPLVFLLVGFLASATTRSGSSYNVAS